MPLLPCHSGLVRKMMGLKNLPKKDPETEYKEAQIKRTDDIIDKILKGKDGANDDFPPELVQFDGNFECANIEQVRRRGNCLYDIWMRNDSNGSGCLQWFMFRIKNLSGWTGIVKINIVNFTKANSLFLKVRFYLLSCRV